MNIFKCDICGHLQENGERFFHLSEITQGDGLLYQDRKIINFDFCLTCYERFQNSEEKVKEKVNQDEELKRLYELAIKQGELGLAFTILDRIQIRNTVL